MSCSILTCLDGVFSFFPPMFIYPLLVDKLKCNISILLSKKSRGVVKVTIVGSVVAGIWLIILIDEIALGYFFTLFTHDIWTAGASILLYMVGYSLITPVSPTILSVCFHYSVHS